MKSEAELKECPFCGGSEIKLKHDDGIHWHACAGCGATGPQGTRYSGEEDDECVGWNTRAINVAAPPVDARRTEFANIYYDNVKNLPSHTKSRASFAMLRDILRHMVYPAVFGEDTEAIEQARGKV